MDKASIPTWQRSKWICSRSTRNHYLARKQISAMLCCIRIYTSFPMICCWSSMRTSTSWSSSAICWISSDFPANHRSLGSLRHLTEKISYQFLMSFLFWLISLTFLIVVTTYHWSTFHCRWASCDFYHELCLGFIRFDLATGQSIWSGTSFW